MIKSFRSKETKTLYNRERFSRFPEDIQRTALRKLWMLNAATSLADLAVPPSNHLEKLLGNRQGQCSIKINNQWRICFQWIESDAYQVEIIDYHN